MAQPIKITDENRKDVYSLYLFTEEERAAALLLSSIHNTSLEQFAVADDLETVQDRIAQINKVIHGSNDQTQTE